jgi:uracil-DNA glycosylase family 4
MNLDSGSVRAALRQQLMADRLLGIRSVPMKTPPRRRRKGSSPATIGGKAEKLRELDETRVKVCRECKLCETRTQTVFGQGDPAARLVFVGEAPGFEEDKQGVAFVGRAGQLLTRMIIAMGLSREDVFICNVLKCRPPQNRDPAADEILACNPYLCEQLAIIQPEVLVALGAPAAKTLLGTAQSIGKLRGRFHEYCLTGEDGQELVIPVMPTYHPAYLLRNPPEKRKVWDDLQTVMKRLGLPAP